MNMDDMILVSIDDHMVEPPDMFDNHVPAKWRDRVPKVVRNELGRGRVGVRGQEDLDAVRHGRHRRLAQGGVGLQPRRLHRAAAGLLRRARAGPRHGRQRRPRLAELPDHGRLQRPHLPRGRRQGARHGDAPGLQRLGHRRVVRRRTPDRFIPLGLVPMWDNDLAVEEIHRLDKKGCRSISFLETPHVQGFPSFLSGHWDPIFKAICDTNMVLSLHIGAGFEVIRRPEEAPIDHLMVLACQISAITAQDLLFGPTLRRFPDLRVALSEGGIGWIPFYFDRIDRHFDNQSWLHGARRVRRQDALRGVPGPHPRLLHHRPLRPARSATASASTTSPGSATTPTPTPPGRTRPSRRGASSRTRGARDDEIHKITWQNSCRFFDWDPFKHTKREDATVGALRAQAEAGGSTRPACPVRSGRSRTRPPASASPRHASAPASGRLRTEQIGRDHCPLVVPARATGRRATGAPFAVQGAIVGRRRSRASEPRCARRWTWAGADVDAGPGGRDDRRGSLPGSHRRPQPGGARPR